MAVMVSAIVGVLWAVFGAPLLLMVSSWRITLRSWSVAALALWLGWMVPEVVRWWRA